MHAIRIVMFLFLAATAFLLPRIESARADAAQTQSSAIWRTMQNCARQATKQFPDHTPEGNTQRENARQACLRANHLPVTEPVPTPAR